MIITLNTAVYRMTLNAVICILRAAVGSKAIVKGRIILNLIFRRQFGRVYVHHRLGVSRGLFFVQGNE
jgi:hypothetical protein